MMKCVTHSVKIASIVFCVAIMLYCTNSFPVVLDVPQQVQVQLMKRPMVAEFYRPSCPHCQRMAPVYEAVANECTNGTRFYRVNCDNLYFANGIARKITSNNAMEISGVPTFVFIDAKGATKEVKKGGMTKQELASTVAQLP